MERVFEDADMKTNVPQFSGNGPAVVVKNTFLDVLDDAPTPQSLVRAQTAPACMGGRADVSCAAGKGMFDCFRENSDTNSNCDSDENDSVYSTTTHDETECLGQYIGIESSLPPGENVRFPVAMAQTAGLFYYNCWPESQFQSGPRPCTSGPQFDQQETWSLVDHAWEDRQYGPLQANASALPQSLNLGVAQSKPLSQPQAMPQPQTVSSFNDPSTGFSETIWNVDAKKLRSGDKQAVSPAFEMPLGANFPSVTFKMIIYPSVKSEGKGGASFKNAKGQGRITIKCEGDVSGAPAQVGFSLAVGNRGERLTEMRYGMHNFAQSAICNLPGDTIDWDLSSVVDHPSETFSIFLTMMHMSSKESRPNSSFVDCSL